MVRLSNDFLQRLKDSVNINDIIGSYVDLKKKGRYYFASCPFHGPEKTPSFSVSPEKGFYYCFGCHESGDIFHFLQKMEGITFMEAVERVADYAHIDMPTEEISPEERQKAAMMKNGGGHGACRFLFPQLPHADSDGTGGNGVLREAPPFDGNHRKIQAGLCTGGLASSIP